MTPAQFYLSLMVPSFTAMLALLAGVMFTNARFGDVNNRISDVHKRFDDTNALLRDLITQQRSDTRLILGKLEEMENRIIRLEERAR